MSINLGILLAALSAVESGDNDSAVGAKAEVSRYQLRPTVWVMNREDTGCDPRNPKCSIVAASRHLHYLMEQIPVGSHSVRQLAAVWNYGFGNCKKKNNFRFEKYPKCVRERAIRVENLYEDLRDVEVALRVHPSNAKFHTRLQRKDGNDRQPSRGLF